MILLSFPVVAATSVLLSTIFAYPRPAIISNRSQAPTNSTDNPKGLLTQNDTWSNWPTQKAPWHNPDDGNDYSNNSFVIEDCFQDPCVRNCETDARVALWKWRDLCDPEQPYYWGAKINYRCWGRSPHPTRCCNLPPGKEPVKSCHDFRPRTDYDAQSCRHGCRFLNGDWGHCFASRKNAGWCKCQWRNCNWDG